MELTEDIKPKSGIKAPHRWWIVLVAFYGCVLFSGSTFFAFSLFIRPLQAEFGWDRSAVAAGFTLLSLAIGMAAPFAGKAVDRFGPSRVMCAGALITALGYGSLFFLGSSVHYYLGHILIGMGGAAMGPVPCTAVVSSWFREKRGLAIGLMSTGIGVGGFAFSPVVGGFIIPSYGWRAGYAGIGLLILTLIPPAFWLIKSNPAADSMERANPEIGEAARRSDTARLKDTVRTAPFLLIAAAFLLSQFSLAGMVQSQVPHLEDIGFPIAAVATALGGVGMMSAVGKLLFGWLCDRIKPKHAFSIGILLMIAGAVTLTAINAGSPLKLVWVYALTIGLGAGSWLPSMSMLVSRYFGMASYGAVFGAVTFVAFIGISTGPLFAGYIFDTTGGYHWAFATFLVLFVVSIPAMMAVKGSGDFRG